MAKFDITEIQETTITTDLAGKIIGIYGTNNVGKSYVAARLFPKQTLWLATEKGYNAQGGLRPYDIETWSDFRDAVAQLTTRNKAKRDKVREMYKCVVVDVADKLPDLSSSYIINQYNEKNSDKEDFTPISDISDIAYGGGYAANRKELDNQINKLALSGYCVCLIFHEEIRKPLGSKSKDDEFIAPKNTFTKAGSVLKDLPDFMIYVQSNGVDDEGNPILSTGYCVQHKEFFARSRFTQCPETIEPFTVDNLKETVRIACEHEAEIQGATTVTYAEEEIKREAIKQSKKLSNEDLIKMIEPVAKALCEAKYKTYVSAVANEYLGTDNEGKPTKISKATEPSQLDALQCIYDKLVDYAESKDINWE